MTRCRHGQQVFHELSADVLLTPGTFDQEIALAQLLALRLDHVVVLAKTAALKPYTSCEPRP